MVVPAGPGRRGRAWTGPELLRGGVRSLLARTKGVRVDHVVETVTARRAEPHEAKLLGIARSEPVLGAVRDSAGCVRASGARAGRGDAG